MGRYNYFREREAANKPKIHPIWSGIGCIMMVLTPILAWAGSILLLQYGLVNKWQFLNSLADPIRFPREAYLIPVINNVANYISSIPYLQALISFFILFLFVLTGLYELIYIFFYKLQE